MPTSSELAIKAKPESGLESKTDDSSQESQNQGWVLNDADDEVVAWMKMYLDQNIQRHEKLKKNKCLKKSKVVDEDKLIELVQLRLLEDAEQERQCQMELAEYRVKQEAKREAERDEKFKAQRKNVQNADKVEQSSKYFTSLEEYDKWEAEQDAENEKNRSTKRCRT